MISTFFGILGSLGVFLFGMRVMSDGLQKAAGNRMQSILNFMTRNRVFAVLTGFLITALVQSSSATTVMVVSFVNAGLLNLTQSIGVIMGANIGTTVTTWIVSVVGFKMGISALALPIVGIGLPFILSKRRNRRDFGEILVGFGLLFLGLSFLKESVPDLDIEQHRHIIEWLQGSGDFGIFSFLLFVGVGTLLTVIVQSSSAAMAITVTMAFKGWIDFPVAAAIVLGENIGTTITAFLASIGTQINARRAARAHMLFNVLGVVWIAFVFGWVLKLVLWLAPWDTALVENLPLNLALFHTIFNIANTLLFIGFVPYFAKLVVKLVPGKDDVIPRRYSMRYLSGSIQDTPQFYLIEAKREINKMGQVAEDMLRLVVELFLNPDKKMGDQVERIQQMEELTDQMQEEISRFLLEITKDDLNEQTVRDIHAYIRIVHELESVGDSCFRLMLLSKKRYERNIKLHEHAEQEIREFAALVMRFVEFFHGRLTEHLEEQELQKAVDLEIQIDQYRDRLKKDARRRMQAGADVKAELMYIDFLRHFEHIGDNSLNISQAMRQKV
ncbi:MAG: Na/Pi cotransporter family protein [Candidatus Cloacimonetes bacterium]|nr:Na/Pi cotransporter family protein [Candidatus Cloacimonadota bacterium]